MYNRYLQGTAGQAVPEYRGPEEPPSAAGHAAPSPPPHKSGDLLKEVTGGLGDLLGGVLKHFSLEKVDTGDILLVLIILFLFLEGDNLELVITLGLMLLLGLGDDQPALS